MPTTDDLRAALLKAAIPLEILASQIRYKPYRELSEGLQQEILEAADALLEVLPELTGPSATPPPLRSDDGGRGRGAGE